MTELNKDVRQGDPLSAEQWREIVRRVSLMNFGQGAFMGGFGVAFRPSIAAGESNVFQVEIQDPANFEGTESIVDGKWRTQPIMCRIWVPDPDVWGEGENDGGLDFEVWVHKVNCPQDELVEPEALDLYNTLDANGLVGLDASLHSSRYDIIFRAGDRMDVRFETETQRYVFCREVRGIHPAPWSDEICS